MGKSYLGVKQERRSTSRQRTVFRPAYIRVGDKLHFVTMRNVSTDGARFDGLSGLHEGQEVHYCVGDSEPILAFVKWKDGSSFGVENAIEQSGDFQAPVRQAYRSVRLPVLAKASIYMDGFRFEGYLMNLSQRGACIESSIALKRGDLLTLEIGGFSLENSEVRWVDGKKAGFRFAKALDSYGISQILEKVQCSRADEVVIANTTRTREN